MLPLPLDRPIPQAAARSGELGPSQTHQFFEPWSRCGSAVRNNYDPRHFHKQLWQRKNPHEIEIIETAQARPYKFGDFFAGFGGLSTAMEYAAQGKEEVHMTVGGFAGQRNILHDAYKSSDLHHLRKQPKSPPRLLAGPAHIVTSPRLRPCFFLSANFGQKLFGCWPRQCWQSWIRGFLQNSAQVPGAPVALARYSSLPSRSVKNIPFIFLG